MAVVRRAYRFALAPSPAQEQRLRSHAGAARFAWNWGLARWHREGLRELCARLFAQRSTRTVRAVMSSAFRKLGEPAGD
jgi:transposase